ncbi:DUF1778 domain-containing protein [Sphingobium sp. H39-3-25]|uniref:type II toxin-antitoxin system TacA family antitoxin n=1 Tax=Sphingobium arseniciresistens TaxID=3030834 RepID=UPI0023BA0A4C|nr:DUF1778 domain-containing protein [Sphingobium arseniciresistens]
MVTNSQERRSEPLEVRVPPSLHSRVSQATALHGQTVAAFVTAAIQDAAQRAIDDAKVTRLNRDEFAEVMRAIDSDREPNSALAAAVARHRTITVHA